MMVYKQTAQMTDCVSGEQEIGWPRWHAGFSTPVRFSLFTPLFGRVYSFALQENASIDLPDG
jgi:hypothetical protein